jgi:hypothetical protein
VSDYRTDIASIWQMFDESGALAHRTAIAAAQQAASNGSRVIIPASGALNTSTLNAVTLNGTGIVLPSLDLMLQAVVTVGEKTVEGQIIEAVSMLGVR